MHLSKFVIGVGALGVILCIMAAVVLHLFSYPMMDTEAFLKTTPGTILGVIGSIAVIVAIFGIALFFGEKGDRLPFGRGGYDE